MDHFNKQVSLVSYSPYQLLYRWKSILSNLIYKKLTLVIDLNDIDFWTQYLYDQRDFFKKAMPMAIKNLYII